jgi:hypothetical protein
LQHLVAQPPANFAQPGVRWKLATLGQAVWWLQGLTLSGVWRQLERAGISLKHARHYVHSPDLQYLEKLAEIVRVLELVVQSDGKIVLLFADELTFYRQPTLSFAYSEQGKREAPRGILSHQSNTSGRIGGVVNALTGQVTYRMASKFGITEHLKLYEQLREVYPTAEVIYLVEDNCPLHFHPTVLNALVEQATPFELKIPPSWENVVGKEWKKEKLPIQILPLPTYASWCNPIEKLWRWLKQEVLHLHRKADDWNNLKEEIKKFLDKFREKSASLLKYIGLTENSKLYGATLSLLTEQRI